MSFDELFKVLDEYKTVGGEGEGWIGRIQANLGFVVMYTGVWPQPFFAADLASKDEGLAFQEARLEAGKAYPEAKSGSFVLAVQFLVKEGDLLNVDTSEWTGEVYQKLVNEWDHFETDDGVVRPFRELVVPSIQEHLDESDLGKPVPMQLKMRPGGMYAKQGEDKEDPSTWTGRNFFPYVGRKFANEDEMFEALGGNAPIASEHKLHNIVDPPEGGEWEDGVRDGMDWEEWVGSIQGGFEKAVGADGYDYHTLNKPKQIKARKSILADTVSDWGDFVPEEKLEELLDEFLKADPAF